MRKAKIREGINGLERQCFVCEAWLPATTDYFYKHTTGFMGLGSKCKTCVKALALAWQRKNPEKARAAIKKWEQKNPEKIKRKSTRQARANLEKHRENGRQWRKKNPERARASVRKWQLANPEKTLATLENWWKKNPDKRAEYGAKRRALELGAEGEFSTEDIELLYEIQTGKCCWCSTRIMWDEKTIEHIRALERGGSNYPYNLVIACKSCNSSKRDKLLFEEWQPKNMLVSMAEHIMRALKLHTDKEG